MVSTGRYGRGARPSWTTARHGKFKEFCQIREKRLKIECSIVRCHAWLNTDRPNERHGSKFQLKSNESLEVTRLEPTKK